MASAYSARADEALGGKVGVGREASRAVDAFGAVAAEAERVEVRAKDARTVGAQKIVLGANQRTVVLFEVGAVDALRDVADVLKSFEARISTRTRAVAPAAADVHHAAALGLGLARLRRGEDEQT